MRRSLFIAGCLVLGLAHSSQAWAAKSRGAKRAAAAKVRRPASVKPKDLEPESLPAQAAAAPPAAVRGPTRIDFDDRLIQGQTNKSGAVYLYDRKELKTRSMVHKRESFREEIVGFVYDP